MYSPTSRLLTILEVLQSRDRVSGPELATRVEVNVRTVRRYITTLQDLGIPVEAEYGSQGAYRLKPGFKLPPLMFNEEEAFALTLGLLAVRHLGLTSAAEAVEGALAKVERVLPVALGQRVQAMEAGLVLGTRQIAARTETDGRLIMTVSAAAQQGQSIWVDYYSEQLETTHRQVDPYTIVFWSGYWYVVGYCHLRKGLRMFRLDRVLEVELSEETFIRPPDFDGLEYLVRSISTRRGSWQVEALLDITLTELQRQLSPTLATFEQTPDGIILRCVIDDLDRMARFLVGLGCDFTVKQPPELKEALSRLSRRVLEIASTS